MKREGRIKLTTLKSNKLVNLINNYIWLLIKKNKKKERKNGKTRHHMPSNISTQAIYEVFWTQKNH